MIPETTFTLGNRVQVADPSYSNDALAGPFSSVQDCIEKFPEELRHEGRKVGITQANGRIGTYEWHEVSPGVWEIAPFVLSKADQIINSGGNYNNLALTGNVIVFNNTDIQAVINGIEFSTYKKISLVNQSSFALRLNSENTNADLNQKLNLPTDFVLIDPEGSADMVYVEDVNAWKIQSTFNTKYIPQHKNLLSKQVLLVNEQNETETEETSEFEVFRSFQDVAMSKSDLNIAYPNAEEGFMVVCRQIDIIYKKIDINTGDWKPINMGPNVV